MLDNLAKVYNTLLLVETKGESTKTMGKVLEFLEQLIVDEKTKQRELPTKKEEE